MLAHFHRMTLLDGMIAPVEKSLTCPNPKSLFGFSSGFRQLHYVEWGDATAEKTAVCVHGLTRNARDFDFLACALVNEGYRVICPDVVGRGKSEWLKWHKFYGYPLYVADMSVLFSTLGLVDVDYIGTSMGGLIGMMLETSVPHIIGRMVLNDIGPYMDKAALQRIGSYVGQKMEFADMEEAGAYLKQTMAPFGITDEAHWQHLTQHSYVQQENGRVRAHYDPTIGAAFWNKRGKQRTMQDIDLWQMWEVIRCNMLVLRGEESDLLSVETAQRMAQRENVDLVEFSGIGHAPALMAEDQIKVVTDWLA